MFEENKQFHRKIIFSNEEDFWLNGLFNKKKFDHVVSETPLTRKRLIKLKGHFEKRFLIYICYALFF